jgi:hypothetical protein
MGKEMHNESILQCHFILENKVDEKLSEADLIRDNQQ